VTGPAPAVAAVRVAVRAVLADVARGTDPDGLVLVACSGGPDSLALAAATAFEAPRAGVRAGAVVVDHGLQDGSAERSAALGERLAALGLEPVDVIRVEVGSVGGPEAAARAARYAALDEAAARRGAVAVLLGHTLDDQAETVLLGLGRGSGARSLSGMPAAIGHYRRPLLGLRRDVTRAACEAEDLTPWDDPHNGDPAYTRSRVRATALPALESALGPGVPEALARSARLLRADADALDAWAARERGTVTSEDGSLDGPALAALPAAVRTRILRSAALSAGSPAGALTAGHVEAVDALVTAWHGQGPVDLPGGVRAERACDRLRLARHRPPEP
jgi:tRNA(Ile)-lysidine synthase